LPIATIVLDVALLVALVIVRADIAPVSLIVASAVAAAIFLSQVLVARQRQRG
jgi:hypothetical protein